MTNAVVTTRAGGTSRRLASWVARAVWLLGAVSVVSALLPGLRARLGFVRGLLPAFLPHVAVAATLVTGVLLILVASGLRRRKRRAWWVALVLASVSALLHVVKGLDFEEAGLSAAVLVLLLATRGRFTAAADPPGHRRALARTLLFAAIALGLGSSYLALRHREFVGHPGVGGVLAQAAAGLVGVDGPLDFVSARAADRAAVVLGTLGLLTGLGIAWALLHPVRPPSRCSAAEEPALRALLAGPEAGDSLGYFALREDKMAIMSPSGKAAIAYRVVGGVSLAAGDPLGDAEAWPGAITAWLDEAAEHAWVPAVLGAGERAATVYARYGLDALELGDEAILDGEHFTLEGRPMRTVRQAVNRVRRSGVTATVDRVGDLPGPVLAEVRAAATAFRDGSTERGFSMALGRFGDPADPACVLVRATGPAGELVGLLHLVPWGSDGLSLDLMRRSASADNGLVEFLVAELMTWVGGHGVRRVSLNFAVFRAVFARGERVGAGPVLRLWRRVLVAASRLWQIESLYRANAKFQPTWVPRFVCFANSKDLPMVILAALRAEAFLVAPRWFGRHRGLS